MTDPAGQGRLVVISGPSGAGKSSVVAGIRRRRPIHFSVSVTTRPPRPGEVEGTHYSFVTPEQFVAMAGNGELMEWAEYNGNLYGTPAAAVKTQLEQGRDVLLEIEVQGARQIRSSHTQALMFFISPPSLQELERRLRGRGDTSEENIRRRLEIARSEMAEAERLFDHIVVNDDLEQTVATVDRLLSEGGHSGRIRYQ
jgi:guanylate kinase